MCVEYLKRFADKILDRAPALDKAFLTDYAKLYTLVRDRPLFVNCLGELEQAILAGRLSDLSEVNWLRLSAVLGYYERKCWFPEDVLLPLGILSNDDFYFYIRRGYVLKDYGAGVKHGEFTHRLQWHVFMWTVTAKFTQPFAAGWAHTPLELYTSLGRKENRGVWGLLMDQSGGGKTDPFDQPDALHEWLLGKQAQFPCLVGMASKRETKRREQFVRAVYDYLSQHPPGGAVRKKLFLMDSPLKSHEAFKQFELWFVNDVLTPTHPNFDAVKKTYYELKGKSDPAYVAQKTAPVDSLAAKPKHRSTAYVPTGQGPVYKLSSGPLLSESDADTRALASRGKLFDG